MPALAIDKSCQQPHRPKVHSMTKSESNPFVRHDWMTDEIVAILDLPLLELISEANRIHRHFHRVSDVQKASLLSIKTGGCPEDCAYCPQSAHYREVHLDRIDMMKTDAVLAVAARAKDAGADRFCMGAAWRSVRDGTGFDAVLDMVRGVRALGLEACVTLGMLNASSPPTITISTQARNSTQTLSRREPTRIGLRPCVRSGRPDYKCAAAAS
jgi:biotin synthase-like enzyme